MTTIELLLAGLIIGLALVSLQLYVLTKRIAFLGWACKEQHKLLIAASGLQIAWSKLFSVYDTTKEQSNETKQND